MKQAKGFGKGDDQDDDEQKRFLQEQYFKKGSPRDRILKVVIHKRLKEFVSNHLYLLVAAIVCIIMICVFTSISGQMFTSEQQMGSHQQNPNQAFKFLTQMKSEELLKPKIDQNNYKYLKLSNDLKVLLISDKTAKFSSASIDVFAGSWSEPKEWPGLAHFLEHMIFIMSKTYPESAYFDNFLSKNGGYSNAYTTAEHTNYFFTIQSSKINEGLKIFAHMFIDPLFPVDAVEKESSAVNGEYNIQLSSSGWKNQNLINILSKSDHPQSRFHTGNTETLRKEGVSQALENFFKQYYSANQMAFVLHSNLDIESMEKLVTEAEFDKIQNNQRPPTDFTQFGKPLPPENLGKIVKLQVSENSKTLNIVIQVDGTKKHYKDKPLQYIIHMVNYEGEGGLKDMLLKQNLIMDFQLGIMDEFDSYTLMEATFYLTDEGINHIGAIVNQFIINLNKIKTDGVRQDLFQQQKDISNLSFSFKSTQSMDEGVVSDYASALNQYPYPEVMAHDFIYDKFNKDLISSNIDQLADPKNMLIIVSDNFLGNGADQDDGSQDQNVQQSEFIQLKQKSKEEDSNKKETQQDILKEYTKFLNDDNFDTYVKLYNVNISQSSQFNSIDLQNLQTLNKQIADQIQLKPITPYIPQDTKLISLCDKGQYQNQINNQDKQNQNQNQAKLFLEVDAQNLQNEDLFTDKERYKQFKYEQFIQNQDIDKCTKEEQEFEQEKKYPQLIQEDDNGQIWYKLERSLQIPKGGYYALIKTGDHYTDAKHQVMLSLLSQIIQTQLQKEFFDALSAGYSIDVDSMYQVISLQVFGWSEKLPMLLEKIMISINNLEITQNKFEISKSTVESDYEDLLNSKIYRQIIYLRLPYLLIQPQFNIQEYLQNLEQIQLQDLVQFQKEFFSECKINSLIMGNVKMENAKAMALNVFKQLNVNAGKKDDYKFKREILNLSGHSLVFRDWANGDEQNQNSGTINYYQYGLRTLNSIVCMHLLDSQLNSFMYNYLRTERELGYVAFSQFYSIQMLDSFIIGVEGSKKAPFEVDAIIEEGLKSFKENLANIQDEEFEQMKQALVAQITLKHNKMEDQILQLWKYIQSETYTFDLNDLMLIQIDKINKQDLLNFYINMFEKIKGKISIQLYSQAKNKELSQQLMDKEQQISQLDPQLIINKSDLNESFNYYEIDPLYLA